MMASSPVVEPSDLQTIRALREAHRGSAGCQIVRDSILPRRLADPWAIRVDGEVVGYAGVWREHFPGRLMEFVLSAEVSGRATTLFRAVLEATGSEEVECQTNVPLLAALFREHATEVVTEHLLFVDTLDDGEPVDEGGVSTPRPKPDGGTAVASHSWSFRSRRADDATVVEVVPEGPWVVEEAGRVVAAGGILTHYNPPFGDLYLAVVPQARGRGIGRFLVRSLRSVARAEGLIPAARCDPSNEGSRRALLAGGMRECGSLLSGRVATAYRRDASPRAR